MRIKAGKNIHLKQVGDVVIVSLTGTAAGRASAITDIVTGLVREVKEKTVVVDLYENQELLDIQVEARWTDPKTPALVGDYIFVLYDKNKAYAIQMNKGLISNKETGVIGEYWDLDEEAYEDLKTFSMNNFQKNGEFFLAYKDGDDYQIVAHDSFGNFEDPSTGSFDVETGVPFEGQYMADRGADLDGVYYNKRSIDLTSIGHVHAVGNLDEDTITTVPLGVSFDALDLTDEANAEETWMRGYKKGLIVDLVTADTSEFSRKRLKYLSTGMVSKIYDSVKLFDNDPQAFVPSYVDFLYSEKTPYVEDVPPENCEGPSGKTTDGNWLVLEQATESLIDSETIAWGVYVYDGFGVEGALLSWTEFKFADDTIFELGIAYNDPHTPCWGKVNYYGPKCPGWAQLYTRTNTNTDWTAIPDRDNSEPWELGIASYVLETVWSFYIGYNNNPGGYVVFARYAGILPAGQYHITDHNVITYADSKTTLTKGVWDVSLSDNKSNIDVPDCPCIEWGGGNIPTTWPCIVNSPEYDYYPYLPLEAVYTGTQNGVSLIDGSPILVGVYLFENSDCSGDFIYWFEVRSPGPISFNTVTGSACVWYNREDICLESRSMDDTEWAANYGSTYGMHLFLVSGVGWGVHLGDLPGVQKRYGLTPEGEYFVDSIDGCCIDGDISFIRMTVSKGDGGEALVPVPVRCPCIEWGIGYTPTTWPCVVESPDVPLEEVYTGTQSGVSLIDSSPILYGRYSYENTGCMGDLVDWFEVRLTGTISFAASTLQPCLWSAYAVFEYRSIDVEEWSFHLSSTSYLSLEHGQRWRVSMTLSLPYIDKPYGSTPEGNYRGFFDACCDGVDTSFIRMTIS
jgi:hypothetical protein